jgi:anti-anti-sigma factor
MALTESSSVTVARGGLVATPGRDPQRTVVWMTGDHDATTVAALSENLARAIALDDAELVVDLSDVTFMSASTIGVIVRARAFLRVRSRTMSLRAASSSARLVFEACHLADLLDAPVVTTARVTNDAVALGTWVEVPKTDPTGAAGA